MNTDYKTGDLVYDASLYDGLNTFLSDLPFYRKWLPENKEAKIPELCCGTGRLTILYRTNYSISMSENLAYVKAYGETAFLWQQKDKSTYPGCGKLHTVHRDHCIYCKQVKRK